MGAADTPSDDVLRSALDEHIAFGPATRVPLEERLRRRLPGVNESMLIAARALAGEAVAAAEDLAREHADGKRTEASVKQELLDRFPWLWHPEISPPQSWFRRLFTRGTTVHDVDLATRLASFGFYLTK